MVSARWRKVLRDLSVNKTRTILVVLSIAVGVFAVGVVIGSQIILSHDIAASYAAGNPASAVLYTEPFDDDLVQSVRRMNSVSDVEGRRTVNVRLKVGTNSWRDLQLTAIPDYNNIRLNKVRPEHGAWPPQERELLIERSALGDTEANIGDTLLIETPDGTLRKLRLAGTAHSNDYFGPLFFAGTIWGYVTFDTLQWLGQPNNFNELHLVIAQHSNDTAYIERQADQIVNTVEKSGRTVFRKMIPTPGEHLATPMIQSMIMFLGVMGLFTLFLSALIVVNMLSALLTQHVRQIGVMKAVGARTDQLMQMYLVLTVAFGLLALLIAIPLAVLGTREFTNYIANTINFDLDHFNVPLQMILSQVLVGLLAPLLAALYPVLTGTRVTVSQAINNYKVEQFGRSVIDHLLTSLSWLSRPLLLSLRNTFRRKGRLLLTLATLTLGSTIFISVFTVRESLILTRNDFMKYHQEDVMVRFNSPYRYAKIKEEALSVPSVIYMEGGNAIDTRRLRLDDSESNSITLNSMLNGSDLIQPTIVEGRWLLPEDTNAIVIGTDLKKAEPDIRLGDEIVLKIKARQSTWQVVGIVLTIGINLTNTAYANEAYVSRVAQHFQQVNSVKIVTEKDGAAFQAQIANVLEERFKQAGLRVSAIRTNTELNTRTASQFNIIVFFLSTIAALVTVVGGLSLMGTMSINVLERTREIGILRAIGASDGAIQQIVIVEGVLIGVLSWLLGSVFARPISKILSDYIGVSLFNAPLRYTFSIKGVLLWLIVVIILAMLATFLPARNASRLKIREALEYQ